MADAGRRHAGRIDWAGLMRAGLMPPPLGLGLTPAVFWALTPVELRLMLGREAGAAPMTRARLKELAAAFPDNQEEWDGRNRRAGGPAGSAGGADGICGGNDCDL